MKKNTKTVGGFQIRTVPMPLSIATKTVRGSTSPNEAVLAVPAAAPAAPKRPNYKYGEDKVIEEIRQYVDSTYGGHYAQGSIQAAEFISSLGMGMTYYICNIIKYASRYGRKDGFNKKDLMKVAHYAIMALNEHHKDQFNAK